MATEQGFLQGEQASQTYDVCVAFELSNCKWKLVWCGRDHKIRQVTLDAGSRSQVLAWLDKVRSQLKLAAGARFESCYEAGRDGFWLHRWLVELGVHNRVVDSSSIEVNRQMRRSKTDSLDGQKLLGMLLRELHGEKHVWRVVSVPSVAQEDERRPYRERERLRKEKEAHTSRIQSLLILHNLRPERIGSSDWSERLKALELSMHLRAELERETARLTLVLEQLKALENEQAAEFKAGEAQQHQLRQLKAIGVIGALGLVKEFFGWKHFANRRQVASAAGLTPTPYASGELMHEQGISKAGNKRVRSLMVELSWQWLRHQPQSELSRWFIERFGSGGKRMRRIGIIALARRLLIALWRYVEEGKVPPGAQLKPTA